ncbi:unnamed protein product [marine sediment metagenome]|uniref:Uncharacterized protein n=1 Tax=marine sediment metagenome TaxID=412755 RepID=X1SQJ1_9ZZZZ
MQTTKSVMHKIFRRAKEREREYQRTITGIKGLLIWQQKRNKRRAKKCHADK